MKAGLLETALLFSARKGKTNEVKVGTPIGIVLLNPFLAWPKGIVTVGKEVLVLPLLRTTHRERS